MFQFLNKKDYKYNIDIILQMSDIGLLLDVKKKEI